MFTQGIPAFQDEVYLAAASLPVLQSAHKARINSMTGRSKDTVGWPYHKLKSPVPFKLGDVSLSRFAVFLV